MSRATRTRRAALALTLERDLNQIATAKLSELRTLWSDRLGGDPPPLRSREIFRRMLAYGLQATALGDLSAACQRKLAAMEVKRTNPARKRPSAPLKLGHGAMLIREWKGVRHEVRVMPDGFHHDGAVYGSLSEVARHITGSRWNGRLFFGLRTSAKAAG